MIRPLTSPTTTVDNAGSFQCSPQLSCDEKEQCLPSVQTLVFIQKGTKKSSGVGYLVDNSGLVLSGSMCCYITGSRCPSASH